MSLLTRHRNSRSPFPFNEWRRVRFGHSPSSFTALWHVIFTELNGEDFANEHVKVEAIMRDSGELFKESKGLPVLIWSVKIVRVGCTEILTRP